MATTPNLSPTLCSAVFFSMHISLSFYLFCLSLCESRDISCIGPCCIFSAQNRARQTVEPLGISVEWLPGHCKCKTRTFMWPSSPACLQPGASVPFLLQMYRAVTCSKAGLAISTVYSQECAGPWYLLLHTLSRAETLCPPLRGSSLFCDHGSQLWLTHRALGPNCTPLHEELTMGSTLGSSKAARVDWLQKRPSSLLPYYSL